MIDTARTTLQLGYTCGRESAKNKGARITIWFSMLYERARFSGFRLLRCCSRASDYGDSLVLAEDCLVGSALSDLMTRRFDAEDGCGSFGDEPFTGGRSSLRRNAALVVTM
ncbi:hypothetical protein DERF_012457 [Dermatophagoides farinae]|uniref:Uncharacterized protein n=1 Tax=Dermatophagoides farinae TaxID=6954 RepID=A0A922HS70_DERFA|nr:hypothetical protein DERF_012457 [Dermatophagoides farinae]